MLSGLLLGLALAQGPAGVAVGQAPAESPTAAEVAAKLASDDPAEVAWGAFLAGERRVYEAVPALVERASGTLPGDGALREAIRMTIADALIRLDAELEPEEVMAVVGDRARGALHAQTLILLPSKRLDSRRALFAMLDDLELSQDSWNFTARVLATTRARGIGARLMAELVLELDVMVRSANGRIGGRRVCSLNGRHRISRPQGFPPFSSYRLFTYPVVGAQVLLGGPLPVYFLRLGDKVHLSVGGGPPRVARSRCAQGFLSALLEEDGDLLAPQVRSALEVLYVDGAQYRSLVEGEIDRLRAGHATLVQRLIDSGLLSTKDAEGLAPQVTLRVFDWRPSPVETLPELPFETTYEHRAR
jgi:hypothetical protein